MAQSMDLGKRMKDFIDRNGIKQSYISEMTGIKPVILSNLLSGKRCIYVQEYMAICKVLGLPLDYFTDDEQAAAQDAG